MAILSLYLGHIFQVQLYTNSPVYFQTDANGSFKATVVLSGYQPGSNILIAADAISEIQVGAAFVVQ